MTQTGDVTQKFYCNDEQTKFVIITENKPADSKQICVVSLEEDPKDSATVLMLSVFESDEDFDKYLLREIDSNNFHPSTSHDTKLFIKKYERRSQELINFCEL